MFAFTSFHVVISLVGIASGFVVLYGMLANERLPRWTMIFLATTVATSVTGFGFPADRFLPSHALAILSLLVLAVAIFALYARKLGGGWRLTYIVTVLVAQYFNVFVLVVQSFQKVSLLHSLAPTQTELPFALAQLSVLAVFVVAGVFAVRRFQRPLVRSVVVAASPCA